MTMARYHIFTTFNVSNVYIRDNLNSFTSNLNSLTLLCLTISLIFSYDIVMYIITCTFEKTLC